VGVVQLPLRAPVGLAHRVQAVNVLSGGRLRLGVGAGSTRDDFEALNADWGGRFRALPEHLDVMQRIWRGEGVYGPPISAWPGTEGGPPVYLGAWRSERWINLAAQHCQGWMASGNHVGLEDIEKGVQMFRAAGGQRALVTSIHTDVRPEATRGKLTTPALFNLHCSPSEARDRLKHLEDIGFDDAVMYPPSDDPSQLEAIRGLVP
jgi:alkanesulfonate monooxygenase SsuD/methylene tetrahydromethanopterin reductase-like flavin-dependent oxidoreductase (luciferase family)